MLWRKGGTPTQLLTSSSLRSAYPVFLFGVVYFLLFTALLLEKTTGRARWYLKVRQLVQGREQRPEPKPGGGLDSPKMLEPHKLGE